MSNKNQLNSVHTRVIIYMNAVTENVYNFYGGNWNRPMYGL